MSKRVKSDNKKGAHAVGSITKLSSTRCRVDFETGEAFHIEISDTTVPEILNRVLTAMPDNTTINVDVTLDETSTKVLFVKPLKGTYDFKFVGFLAPKDTEPKIEVKAGPGKKPYGMFSAIVEVLKKTGGNDVWRGVRYTIMFFDAFTKTDDGLLAVKDNGSDNANLLSDFLDATGVGNDDIPYSENPLPTLQRLMLEKDRVFSADVNKTVTKDGKAYANVVTFNLLAEEFDFDKVSEVSTTDGKTHPALEE